jgi:HEAT repeat protein
MVTLIKWLFFIMLGAFLFVGVSLQINQAPEDESENRILDISRNHPSERKVGISEQFQAGLAKLKDPSPQERVRGIQIVMAADPANGPLHVQPLLADPEPTVRVQALTALVTFGTPGIGTQIVAMVNDPDALVRASAVGALPQFTSEAGLIYQLGTALSSQNSAVVMDAINAWRILAPADPNSAAGAIQVALGSNDEQVVSTALGALGTVYHQGELAPFVGTLQSIQSRFPDRPVAQEAARLEKEAAS